MVNTKASANINAVGLSKMDWQVAEAPRSYRPDPHLCFYIFQWLACAGLEFSQSHFGTV